MTSSGGRDTRELTLCCVRERPESRPTEVSGNERCAAGFKRCQLPLGREHHSLRDESLPALHLDIRKPAAGVPSHMQHWDNTRKQFATTVKTNKKPSLCVLKCNFN